MLEVTETGLKKSIMDATRSVRELLVQYDLHDYDRQPQGTDSKVLLPAIVFSGEQTRDAKARYTVLRRNKVTLEFGFMA